MSKLVTPEEAAELEKYLRRVCADLGHKDVITVEVPGSQLVIYQGDIARFTTQSTPSDTPGLNIMRGVLIVKALAEYATYRTR